MGESDELELLEESGVTEGTRARSSQSSCILLPAGNTHGFAVT